MLTEPDLLPDTLLELSRGTVKQTWWPFVGTSMFPYIKEGDILLVQHILCPIRLGDVIVFRRANALIAHRVVFISKHSNRSVYRTKGDKLFSFDAPVPQSSVLGRVICIQKNGKSISLEATHIKFFNFVIALSSYAAGILCQVTKLGSLFAGKGLE